MLGRRIAACFMAAGNTVRIRDPTAAALEQSQGYIRENISAFTTLTSREAGCLEIYDDLAAAVRGCWLVIEAVPEILSLKEATFADLEKLAPDDCILATNSSSYKSSELLLKVQHEKTKTRVCNMHFMMPPEVRIQLWFQ